MPTDDEPTELEPKPSFISRVWNNDSTRKGVAGAIAGALVGVISEAMRPKI